VNELRVRLDPCNPGQFLACCGLFELLDLEYPGLLARFEYDANRPRLAHFVASAENDGAVGVVLGKLRQSVLDFSVESDRLEASILPARIVYPNGAIELDWWLDEFRESTVNLKCWAGQVTTKGLFSELQPLLDPSADGQSLFHTPSMTKSKFGVDPRSAWNALDLGFSPNEHGRDSATFAAVEVLAAVGLQTFRPDANRRESVRYSLWFDPLPCLVARVAFRAPWNGLRRRSYRFAIDKRGQSYKYFTFAEEESSGDQVA